MERLIEVHEIVDKLRNIEVKTIDEDKLLLLLSLLSRSFKSFKDVILYGNDSNVIFDEVQEDVRSKKLSMMK